MQNSPTPNKNFYLDGSTLYIKKLERPMDINPLIKYIGILLQNNTELTIEFTEKFRIFPNIITPLAAAIDFLKSNGKSIYIDDSVDPSITRTRLKSPADINNETDKKGSPHNKIWKVSSPEDVYKLVTHIIEFLLRKMPWEEGTLHSVEWSLYEMLDNIFHHANARCGFLMFQIQTGNRLIYCLADQGRGIYSSLAGTAYASQNPADAITLAIQKGVTRNSVTNMGNGLWGSSEIVKNNGGEFRIFSGGAAIYFNPQTDLVQKFPNIKVLSNENPGTTIDVQVKSSIGVDIKNMFEGTRKPVNLRIEQMEDDDDAIVIKMDKLIQGAGTRKSGIEARTYISNTLTESNKQVKLDFSDVAIISSSFADECISKLYLQLKEKSQQALLVISNANPTIETILKNVTEQRINIKQSTGINSI